MFSLVKLEKSEHPFINKVMVITMVITAAAVNARARLLGPIRQTQASERRLGSAGRALAEMIRVLLFVIAKIDDSALVCR